MVRHKGEDKAAGNVNTTTHLQATGFIFLIIIY